MNKSSWRRELDRGSRLVWVVTAGMWFLIAAALLCPVASAETYTLTNSLDESDTPEATDKSAGTGRPLGAGGTLSEDGPGIEARTGYIGFKTFGRNESITHVELMPFVRSDDEMLFADFRLFLSNDGRFGGNTGLGFRHRVASWDRVFGAGLWYDIDDTTGEVFHQMALGLETYGNHWEFRSNLYFPFDDEKDFQRRIGLRFDEHSVLYDRHREFGEAMEGLDLELGAPLPTQFARDHDLRVYGGWYSFWGDAVPDINGYKFRLEAHVTPYVTTQLGWTDDDTFGRNFTLGVAVTTPGGFRSGEGGKESATRGLRRYPQRNYNIIVSKQTEVQRGLTAINPATGQPYVVQHVSSAGGGLGTPDDPFATIADAQAAGGDIIFVHAGSVFSDPVVLGSGERILGEGVRHFIALPEFGNVVLPRVTSGTVRPMLAGVTGTAVTLAPDAEFAGFVIDSPTGNGIIGDAAALDGALVRDVDITDAALNGVLLRDVTGRVTLSNVDIVNAGGAGLYVNRGSADVVFDGSIENTAGRALLVKNTTGGTVDLSGATIADDGGNGIGIFAADGDVIVGDAAVRNSTGVGIDIQTGSGSVEFRGTTTVVNAADAGIKVKNLAGSVDFNAVSVTGSDGNDGVRIVDSPGSAAFGTLDVNTTNGAGLFVADSGSVSVESGTIVSVGGSAVDVENTEMNVHLTSVSSDGAVNGIRIVDSPGEFIVLGDDDFGTGGLIQNADTGVLVENVGTVAFQFLDMDANTVGIDATDTTRLVLAGSRIANTAGLAVDALNAGSVEISDSGFGSGIRLRADTVAGYDYRIIRSTFTSDSSAGVEISTVGAGAGSSLALSMTNNAITNSGAGDDDVALTWDGPLVAAFNGNFFAGSGGSNDGIHITTTSTTELAELTVTQNIFSFDGGSDTGLRVTTAGPANLTIGQNRVDFHGAFGTGFDFTLAESADGNIFQNVITDYVSGDTGILFTSIAGPSEVTLNSNVVDVLSPGAGLDRGIIFTSVTDTITLSGTQNNLVNGATTDFSAPIGTTTGQIFVNGVLVP